MKNTFRTKKIHDFVNALEEIKEKKMHNKDKVRH